ncbi:opioid-binding protein/cell adhesion molecule homolog isoform X2 [Anthonomus grandis grandis]|nr:opioid-binding protein/cell adhesion molecule homolog isoform X2 [Anthonomus grandis grandis]
MECAIDKLSAFKVAWLRVDTQTILTIHNHVITKNHRIAVTHLEHKNWYLHIRDVKRSDMGWYMCQINTDPMKSQVGYLNVVVPPDILDYATSTDMVAREGTNVTIQCTATGSPMPIISWRREGGEPITLSNGKEVLNWEGPMLNITKVNRLHMGAYLCIASNGVPPSISKRIMLVVHFPPMIWIQNQLVGGREGEKIILECHSEAYPKSINYWTNVDGKIITQGSKFEPVIVDNMYKVYMKLTIKNVSHSDFGTYKCLAKNSLGDTDGAIKLYYLPTPSTVNPVTFKTERTTPRAIRGPNKTTDDTKELESKRINEVEKPALQKNIEIFDHTNQSDMSTLEVLSASSTATILSNHSNIISTLVIHFITKLLVTNIKL